MTPLEPLIPPEEIPPAIPSCIKNLFFATIQLRFYGDYFSDTQKQLCSLQSKLYLDTPIHQRNLFDVPAEQFEHQNYADFIKGRYPPQPMMTFFFATNNKLLSGLSDIMQQIDQSMYILSTLLDPHLESRLERDYKMLSKLNLRLTKYDFCRNWSFQHYIEAFQLAMIQLEQNVSSDLAAFLMLRSHIPVPREIDFQSFFDKIKMCFRNIEEAICSFHPSDMEYFSALLKSGSFLASTDILLTEAILCAHLKKNMPSQFDQEDKRITLLSLLSKKNAFSSPFALFASLPCPTTPPLPSLAMWNKIVINDYAKLCKTLDHCIFYFTHINKLVMDFAQKMTYDCAETKKAFVALVEKNYNEAINFDPNMIPSEQFYRLYHFCRRMLHPSLSNMISAMIPLKQFLYCMPRSPEEQFHFEKNISLCSINKGKTLLECITLQQNLNQELIWHLSICLHTAYTSVGFSEPYSRYIQSTLPDAMEALLVLQDRTQRIPITSATKLCRILYDCNCLIDQALSFLDSKPIPPPHATMK